MRLPHGQVVHAEVLTPLGRVEEVSNWRQLPAKRSGVHRWVCMVSHYFTDEQAEAFAGRTPENPVLLDASNIMYAGLGCVDCETPYELCAGSPCPAGDTWDGERPSETPHCAGRSAVAHDRVEMVPDLAGWRCPTCGELEPR